MLVSCRAVYFKPSGSGTITLNAQDEHFTPLETFHNAALWSIGFRRGVATDLGYPTGSLVWILFVPETVEQRRTRRREEGHKQLVHTGSDWLDELVEQCWAYDVICALVRHLDVDHIACADQGLTKFEESRVRHAQTREVSLTVKVKNLRVLQHDGHEHIKWMSLDCYEGPDTIDLHLGERSSRLPCGIAAVLMMLVMYHHRHRRSPRHTETRPNESA